MGASSPGPRPGPRPGPPKGLRSPRMLAYTRGMSTTPAAPTNPTNHSTRPPAPPSNHASSPAYNPTELAKALLALLGVLLGLTLALGGWQPHTSGARLGWSTGDIVVTNGTDGDTGSGPLSPHDEGVRPAPDNLPHMSSSLDTPSRPVDLPKAYLGDSSRFAPGISPWAGPVDA